MSRERVQAYKRVLRSWQHAGMSNAAIADTIGALDGPYDPFELDVALSAEAAADPGMAHQMSEATGTGIPGGL